MYQYIKLLSDLSYLTGLIGYCEYLERCEVADWLEDPYNQIPDPRLPQEDIQEKPFEDEYPEDRETEEKNRFTQSGQSRDNEPPYLELLILNKWMFTLGDVDCYPSVPHGHFEVKTRKWPKLNPYTGRVFSNIHKDDPINRLSKQDMKKIWNDPKFIDHCREQVIWYSDFAINYDFPKARRGKLVFPRWR